MLSREEYIEKYKEAPYVCQDLTHILNEFNKGNRIIFTKYGDGEHRCMNDEPGRNCDGDSHTPQLARELRISFVNLSDTPNTFLGRWHYADGVSYFLGLYYDHLVKNNKELVPPPFVHYHTFYNDHVFHDNQNLFNFVKAIQETKKHKIVITNNLNHNHTKIFKSDTYVEIPSNSWYAAGLYPRLYHYVANILNNHPDAVILISGGLASKVLISDLSLKYPQASFIDLGSGFDILSQHRYTRSERLEYNNTFENQRKYYAELLPADYTTPFDGLRY